MHSFLHLPNLTNTLKSLFQITIAIMVKHMEDKSKTWEWYNTLKSLFQITIAIMVKHIEDKSKTWEWCIRQSSFYRVSHPIIVLPVKWNSFLSQQS